MNLPGIIQKVVKPERIKCLESGTGLNFSMVGPNHIAQMQHVFAPYMFNSYMANKIGMNKVLDYLTPVNTWLNSELSKPQYAGMMTKARGKLIKGVPDMFTSMVDSIHYEPPLSLYYAYLCGAFCNAEKEGTQSDFFKLLPEGIVEEFLPESNSKDNIEHLFIKYLVLSYIDFYILPALNLINKIKTVFPDFYMRTEKATYEWEEKSLRTILFLQYIEQEYLRRVSNEILISLKDILSSMGLFTEDEFPAIVRESLFHALNYVTLYEGIRKPIHVCLFEELSNLTPTISLKNMFEMCTSLNCTYHMDTVEVYARFITDTLNKIIPTYPNSITLSSTGASDPLLKGVIMGARHSGAILTQGLNANNIDELRMGVYFSNAIIAFKEYADYQFSNHVSTNSGYIDPKVYEYMLSLLVSDKLSYVEDTIRLSGMDMIFIDSSDTSKTNDYPSEEDNDS